jgi:hypothetical protein
MGDSKHEPSLLFLVECLDLEPVRVFRKARQQVLKVLYDPIHVLLGRWSPRRIWRPRRLRSNWIFRITRLRGAVEYLGATRRATYVLALAPVWVASGVLFLSLWPWHPAAEHLAVLGLLGITLVELCLYGLQDSIHLFLLAWQIKPGALAGSKALEQKRQAGLWPLSFDQIWQALIERHGKQSGTKQMIDLLKLSQKYGHQKLRDAIELALATGCYDTAAVRHLLDGDELRHVSCEAIDVGYLERYARPLPAMHEYDQLLSGGVRQ